MTSKEREMFELIQKNPRISQNELAQKLNISRSSVSVHITNLAKKGYILGRGYITDEPDFVCVIGAANIDIIGRSTDNVILEDSNPGRIETNVGGVGRNIGENLARLDVNVKMISVLADDIFGQQILNTSTEAGIDMSHSYRKDGAISSAYLAILDNGGEMRLALSDMSLLEELPIEHLRKKNHILKKAEVIILDACLKEEVIEYILNNHKDTPVFLDPVSVGKSKHVKEYIKYFHTIKVNRLEAEFLSGITLDSEASASDICDYFIESGVKRIFLSMGEKGVYYKTSETSGVLNAERIVPINATGAGDAFMAGLVYCHLKGFDMEFTAKFASCMARITLLSMPSVNPLMSVDKIYKEMEIFK